MEWNNIIKEIRWGRVLLLAFFIAIIACQTIIVTNYNRAINDENIKYVHNDLNMDIVIDTVSYNDKDYISYDDVKVYNAFKKYKNKSNKYLKYDDTSSIISSFAINKNETMINTYINASEAKLLTTKSYRTNYIKNNNIKNDIDLIKFIENNDVHKGGFFSSISYLKKMYSLNYLKITLLPEILNISYISGDYTGYIIESENVYSYNLFINDKIYTFSFYNIDNGTILKIMNSISIID